MKCPKNKFVNLNYTEDVLLQKQNICRECEFYVNKNWGTHCTFSIPCIKCGKKLPQEYLFRLAKHDRATVTHGICDECRVKLADLIDRRTRELGRRPW